MIARHLRLLAQLIRPIPDACECCGARAPLVADHDHATGHFRGWICDRCNTGIGLFGDDEARLLRAIEYLRRPQAPIPTPSLGKPKRPIKGSSTVVYLRGIAEMVGRTWQTIRKWEREGKLPPRDAMADGKAVGWKRSTIEAWLHGEPRPEVAP